MPYTSFLRTNQLKSKTYVSVTFRNENIFSTIYENGFTINKLQFDKGGIKFTKSKEFDLKMVINRRKLCAQKTLKVNTHNKKSYVFIQTDRAIYKPGDIVKIRTVVLDLLLKPALIHTATINVISPLNISFTINPNGSHFLDGYIESEYMLNEKTDLGDWKIKVNIDGKVNSMKIFKVAKYRLPLYDLYVTAPSKISLSDSKFNVTLEALYSFGTNINGEAKICVKSTCIENIQLNPTYSNTFDLKEDFKIKNILSSPSKYNLVVEFTSKLIPGVVKKTVLIDVYFGKECIIKVLGHPKIQGKLSYTVDVVVEEFDGNILIDDTRLITAHLHETTSAQDSFETTIHSSFINGIASFTFKDLREGSNKKIDIFLSNDCQLKNIIPEKEALNNSIHVKYSPNK